MNGVERIAAERRRQIDAEGYTPEHDAEHDKGELAIAAACYAAPGQGIPWPFSERKPYERDPVRGLEKAGALIAAEIDRLLARKG